MLAAAPSPEVGALAQVLQAAAAAFGYSADALAESAISSRRCPFRAEVPALKKSWKNRVTGSGGTCPTAACRTAVEFLSRSTYDYLGVFTLPAHPWTGQAQDIASKMSEGRVLAWYWGSGERQVYPAASARSCGWLGEGASHPHEFSQLSASRDMTFAASRNSSRSVSVSVSAIATASHCSRCSL